MRGELPRLLGFGDLASLTVGAVIGSGIFIVPAIVLQLTGQNVGMALLVWGLGGALSLLGALTYAELAAMRPVAGGLYVYIREAFGGFAAFLYGWALFFVIGSATIATLAVAFTGYLRAFLPLTDWEAKGISVGLIAMLATINVLGTRRSANLQNVTTFIKVAAIVIFSVILLARGDGLTDVQFALPVMEVSTLTALGAAMVGVLWAYEGWHYVTCSAGEVVNPQRNFARGIVVGTVSLVAIYLLANLAFVAALGPERSAGSSRIAAEAVSVILGPAAARLIAVAILISIASAANSNLLTATRVYFAMARDGVFFGPMGRLHPRWSTPAFAIVASAAWGAAMAMTGTFEQLLTYVVFAGWAFYALGAATIFVYRRRDPDAARPFRAPGYPFTPLFFIGAAAAIVINTILLHPVQATVGIGLILLGAPAYWLWRRKSAGRAS